MIKIYIASSWKNTVLARHVARELKAGGLEVDCFCDPSTGRYVFHWTEFVDREEDLAKYNAIEFLEDRRTQRAFIEDKKWLDWADACVLVLPAGRSAHLEAGYAAGQGKPLFITGIFAKGEFDVMYGFAQRLYIMEDLGEMIHEITKIKKEETNAK